jgi:uncharacterized RDD family membrane protein YckC
MRAEIKSARRHTLGSMADRKLTVDQEFAEWYVWAKREVSTDNRVCHGAAQAAVGTLSSGGDRAAAIQAARRSQAGHSLELASQVPALRRSYAEWYDWARREIGGDPGQLHQATGAAIASLQSGGGSDEAAAAARSVHAQAAPPPPAVPVAPPAQAEPAPPAKAQPAPQPWTNPGAPGWVPQDPSPARRNPLYAGFWRRLGAFAVDLVVVLLGCLVVVVFINILLFIAVISTGGQAPADSLLVQLALFLILLVLTWLYFAGLESSAWEATIGKRMVGLLVTDTAGRRLSFGRSTARYFAKLLSALPILIGYLLAAFTPRKQALHDLIAGTLVVRKSGSLQAEAPQHAAEAREPAAIGSGEAQRV